MFRTTEDTETEKVLHDTTLRHALFRVFCVFRGKISFETGMLQSAIP